MLDINYNTVSWKSIARKLLVENSLFALTKGSLFQSLRREILKLPRLNHSHLCQRLAVVQCALRVKIISLHIIIKYDESY